MYEKRTLSELKFFVLFYIKIAGRSLIKIVHKKRDINKLEV